MNKKTVKILLIHIAALGIAAVWIFVFSGTCLFRTVTGIPCPGCGLTRAWLNFFQGNFTYALRYHPLFLLVPPMLFTVIHLRNVFFKKTPLISCRNLRDVCGFYRMLYRPHGTGDDIVSIVPLRKKRTDAVLRSGKRKDGVIQKLNFRLKYEVVYERELCEYGVCDIRR